MLKNSLLRLVITSIATTVCLAFACQGGAPPDIRAELDRVQDVILSEIDSAGGIVTEGLHDLATRDAKLLRPAFTVLAARFQQRPVGDRIVRLAASVEMLHLASLVHDDIEDDDDEIVLSNPHTMTMTMTTTK